MLASLRDNVLSVYIIDCSTVQGNSVYKLYPVDVFV